MGKKKGETTDGSSEEEYVVEKVLDKRTVKGKVGIKNWVIFKRIYQYLSIYVLNMNYNNSFII